LGSGQLELVLKGRGFSRAVNASKLIVALAAAGDVFFKLIRYCRSYRVAFAARDRLGL
jgi:hypothetical protein